MNRRWVAALAIGVPIARLVAMVAGYLWWANRVPAYPRTPTVLPRPNARDDFIAAGRMCKAAHGSERLGPTGAPLLRNGQTVTLANEPDASPAELRAVVARNRAALARLRQGFGKPFGTPPVLMFDQPFPELAQYRELARVLVVEGKLAEREGRLRDAARSYVDCLRLGSMVPRGGPLIHGLVGVAIQAIGLRPLSETVDRLDGSTAAVTAREMLRLEASTPTLAQTLTWEKDSVTACVLDGFLHPEKLDQMSGAGGGGGSDAAATPFRSLSFQLLPKKLIIDHIRGYLDQLIASSRQPYYTQRKPPPLPGDVFSRILVPAYLPVRPRWELREAQWQITLARLAARAYEQQHGGPPPALNAVVPAFLPTVPHDPYAPHPLVYRRQGRGALIYSRGPDGDDDGGKDLGASAKPGMDGDVVTLRSRRRSKGAAR